jgi:hypothetical protein
MFSITIEAMFSTTTEAKEEEEEEEEEEIGEEEMGYVHRKYTVTSFLF